MDKPLLNREQYQAVYHNKGPMLVLAGPGSGKTKVLTERIRILIENYHVVPDTILVITFSKKATIEMQERFKKLCGNKNYPVNFGTFHAVFFNILKNYRNLDRDSILTEKEKKALIMEVGTGCNVEKATSISWQEDTLGKISKYKNIGDEVFEDNDFAIMEDHDKEEFIKIYKDYVKKCNTENKIDFDDMILLCKELLYKHESVLKKIKEHYKYILIDEFQDINSGQYDILRLIAGDDKNVFCVGDDDQSIYAFRGARPEIMTKFLRQFPNCKKIDLLTNYRCCKNIVEASDTIIRHNKNRIERPKQRVFNNINSGEVFILNSESSLNQAKLLVELIQMLKEEYSYKYSDFAIIYRSSHCGKMFELTSDNANIPTESNNEMFDIFAIKEIKVIISYIKIAMHIGEKSDFFQIINNPVRDISRESLINGKDDYFLAITKYYGNNEKQLEVINKLIGDIEFIRDLPPLAAVIYLLKGVGLYNSLKKKFKSNTHTYSFDEIISEFKDIARGFDTLEGLVDFIDNSERISEKCQIKNKDSVHLLTAHASKGLEFKVVFVIGLQEGLFPHNKNLHGISVEEERRLMYVAMTRAKEKLYLCSISSEHGKIQSRFISEIYDSPDYSSFITSNSSLSKYSSKASATASYSSSSSI